MVFPRMVKSEGVKLPFIFVIEWTTDSNTGLLEEDLQLIQIIDTILVNLNVFEFDLPWFPLLEKTMLVFSYLSWGTARLVSVWVRLILCIPWM